MTFESKLNDNENCVKDQTVGTTTHSAGDLSRKLWDDLKVTSRDAGNLIIAGAKDVLDLSTDIYSGTAKLGVDLFESGYSVGRAAYQDARDVVLFADKKVDAITEKVFPMSVELSFDGLPELEISFGGKKADSKGGAAHSKDSIGICGNESGKRGDIHGATPVTPERGGPIWHGPDYHPTERPHLGNQRHHENLRPEVNNTRETERSFEGSEQRMLQQMQMVMQELMRILQARQGDDAGAGNRVPPEGQSDGEGDRYYTTEVNQGFQSSEERMMQMMEMLMQQLAEILKVLKGGKAGKHAAAEKDEQEGGGILGVIGDFVEGILPVAATVAEVAFPMLTPIIEGAEAAIPKIIDALDGEEG